MIQNMWLWTRCFPFAEVQEVFSFFDKDGDGAIVIKELGAVLRSLGFNPEESEINALIEENDKDGNDSMAFPP